MTLQVRQIVRCVLSTAGPPPRRIAAGTQGVRTIILQYDIRTTGQKESRTYCKNRHGDDVSNGAGDDDDGGGGGGDDDGWGYGCWRSGRRTDPLEAATLA